MASSSAPTSQAARADEQGERPQNLSEAVVDWLERHRPPAGRVYDEALAAFADRFAHALVLREHGFSDQQIVDIALAANNLPLASSLMETLGPGPSLARPELLQLAQLRTREGRPELAIESLQTWVATHPLDAAAWQALSAAYRDQNQVLRAVRAEGEVQMAHLDYAGAVDRFKAARALSVKGSLLPADHIEASIIDTRLRLAESRLREQALER